MERRKKQDRVACTERYVVAAYEREFCRDANLAHLWTSVNIFLWVEGPSEEKYKGI